MTELYRQQNEVLGHLDLLANDLLVYQQNSAIDEKFVL